MLVGGVGLETSVTCVNFLLLVGGYDIFRQSCSCLTDYGQFCKRKGKKLSQVLGRRGIKKQSILLAQEHLKNRITCYLNTSSNR